MSEPAYQQIGALCVIEEKIVLITCKKGVDWGLPKATPLHDDHNNFPFPKWENFAHRAVKIAWQKAGVTGKIAPYELRGGYGYRDGVRYGVYLFRLDVSELADVWPESNIRKRRIVCLEEACDIVTIPELQHFLSSYESLDDMTGSRNVQLSGRSNLINYSNSRELRPSADRRAQDLPNAESSKNERTFKLRKGLVRKPPFL